MLTRMLLKNAPEKLPDNLAIIWVEDDVGYEGKEYTASAFRRITGSRPDVGVLGRLDCGDAFYTFYASGWVMCVSYDGGFVGMLVKPDK